MGQKQSVGDIFLGLNIDSSNFNSQLNSIANNAQKSVNKAFGGMGKIIAGALSVAAISAFSKECVELGSDLSEVQNVVDVTFPSMTAQVNEFAKNAINQFGLSETYAKQMTGTFGSMAKAFGFSEVQAYDMSTTLTGLAGDVASFYNLDPSEAYTKLKSVFSGETESLKDLGVVMTQNALDQYALANGYDKTTSAMSEQEKVSLRLAFVTDQLSAASGDFTRTSDSWANKVRVLTLNFQSLKATIGQGLINVLSPLISILNNIIVKLQKAAQWFVTFTSLLSGKKVESSMGSVSSSIDSASSGASSLANNVGSVGKAAKKAAKEMGSLAGFDEITNLKTSSDSSGSSDSDGSGSGGISAGSAIDTSIDTSGTEQSVDKMIGFIDKLKNFLSKNAPIIISLLAGIGAGFVVFETLKNWSVISNGLLSLLTPLTTLQTAFYTFFTQITTGQGVMTAFQAVFGTALGPIVAISVGVAAVTAALVYLYQTSESFRNLVNTSVGNFTSILMNLWANVLKPLFSFLADVFKTVITPIATFIATVFVKAVESIAKVALSFWDNVLAPLANFLVDILAIALQGVLDVWEYWKPTINNLSSALFWLWSNCFSPLADFIAGIFTDTFENWGELIIDQLVPSVKAIFQGLVDFFVGVFTFDMNKAWSGVIGIFEGFRSFLKNVFETDWTQIFGFKLGVQMNTFLNVVKSIWNAFKGIFNGITTFLSGVFTGNWKKAWLGIKTIFSSIVSGFANIFKSPINAIIDGINTFIGGLNKIKIPDWVPGVGGFKFNITKIPKLAEGGYVKANTPQLAMIGDNRTQGEIVSPEGKMYEIMMSALKAYGSNNAGKEDIQVLVTILYEILDAIKNLHLVIDGDSLNDDQKKRDVERALRTGKLIY